MARINWREIIERSKEICEDYIDRSGVAPTLRSLFYQLVSLELIPNTTVAYRTLSKVISKARYEGVFSWEYIRDTTRPVNFLERSERSAREISEDELKEMLESYINEAVGYSINAWEDQPKRVMIVLEKETQFQLISNIVNEVFEWGVYSIRAIRGYDSATDIKRVADDVETISEIYGQIPVVLLITDFDPSGEDIKRDFAERLRLVSKTDNIIFEKIAVTRDQIIRYNLPHRPEDEKEIRKMMRDPRFKRWEYGLYRVELDALLIGDLLDEFKKIVKGAIERHFDYKIFEENTVPRLEEMKKRSEEVRKRNYEVLRKFLGS